MRTDPGFWTKDSFKQAVKDRQSLRSASTAPEKPAMQQNPAYQPKQSGPYYVPSTYTTFQQAKQQSASQPQQQASPTKPKPKTPPLLEYGVKIGDRLFYDVENNTLTKRNTGTPAKLEANGTVVPGQKGDWFSLTGQVFDRLDKKPYLSSTVKYGDALYYDLDKDGWVTYTNQKSERAVPMLDDNNEPIVYSVLLQKAMTGIDPPDPKLDPEARIGNWLFFDPTRNLITSQQTAFPLYQAEDGSLTVEPTGKNFRLDAVTRYQMLGREDVPTQERRQQSTLSVRKPGLPGMEKFTEGEQVYYDPLLNMFTADDPRPSVVPMYIHTERQIDPATGRPDVFSVINDDPNGGIPMKYSEDTAQLLMMYVDPDSIPASPEELEQAVPPQLQDQDGTAYQSAALAPTPTEIEPQTSWFQRTFMGGNYTQSVTLEDAQGNTYPATITNPPQWQGLTMMVKDLDPNATLVGYDPVTGLPVPTLENAYTVQPSEDFFGLDYNGTPMQALQESALIPEQMMGKAAQKNPRTHAIAGLFSSGAEIVASTLAQALSSLLGVKIGHALYQYRQGQEGQLGMGTWGMTKAKDTTGVDVYSFGPLRALDEFVGKALKTAADVDQWINDWSSESAQDFTHYAKYLAENPVTIEQRMQDDPVFAAMHGGGPVDVQQIQIDNLMEQAQSKIYYDYAFAALKNGEVEEAKRLVLDAIEHERKGDSLIDPYYFVTWSKYPEKEQLFLDNVANAVIQVGRPLTRQEIMDIANYHLDVTTEFTWQVAFDLANAVPVEKAISGIVGGVGKAAGLPFKQMWNLIPDKGVKYFMTHVLLKKASSSTASKIFTTVFDPINTIVRSVRTKTWVGDDSVVDVIGRMGDVIAQAKKAANPKEALQAALKMGGLPVAVTPRMLERMLAIAEVIDPADWGKNAEAVYDILVRETAEKIVKRDGKYIARRLRSQGYDEEAIPRQIEIVAKERAASTITPEEFSGKFAQEFKRRYMEVNRAWDGSAVMADSLMGWIGQKNPVLRPAINNASKILGGFMSLWTESVLARRPAWVMYNLIDNVLRYSMAIGTFQLDEVLNLYSKMLDDLSVVPAELGIYHMSDMVEGMDSVMARTISDPSLASMTPVSFAKHYAYSFKQAWDEGYGVFTPFKAWTKAWRDFNGSIEFSYRLRLFHNKFLDNLDLVEAPFLEKFLANMRATAKASGLSDAEVDQVIANMRVIWHTAGNDPDKLKMLSDLTNNAAGDRVVSWWIPDAVREGRRAFTQEDFTLFIGSVKAQLDLVVQDIVHAGREVTVEDINHFFDEITRQIRERMEDAADPEGMLVSLRGIAAEWIDDRNDILGAAKQLGFTEAAAKLIADGEGKLPGKWNPALRTAFKRNGIDTTKKTPQEAYRELMSEFNQRANQAIDASYAAYPERVRAYHETMAALEAAADEVAPRAPETRLAGVEQADAVARLSETLDTLDPADPIRSHAMAQRDAWSEMQSTSLHNFLLFVYPGAKMERLSSEVRSQLWQVYDALSRNSYRVTRQWVEEIEEQIASGTYRTRDLTTLEFLQRHGIDVRFDDNGNVAGVFIALPNRAVPHRLSQARVELFEDIFRAKTRTQFEEPLTARKISAAERTRIAATQRRRAMPTFEELKQSDRAIGRRLRAIDDATTPEQLFQARRAAALEMSNTYKFYTGDIISTVTEARKQQDGHLLGVINKWRQSDTPYAHLGDVPPEEVYAALLERRKYRIAYDIPEYQSDFRDDMLKIMREQYGMRKEEAEATVGIYEAAAEVWGKRYNQSPEKFWATVFRGFHSGGELPGVMGATIFEQGRALIKSFRGANITTALHEFFHALRGSPTDPQSFSWLPEADVQILDNWARPIAERNIAKKLEGQTVDDATRESMIQIEMLEVEARGWEFHLKSGIAPSVKLGKIFENLKQFMGKIYARLKNYFAGADALTPEVARVYDRILDDTWVDDVLEEQLPGVSKPIQVAEMEGEQIVLSQTDHKQLEALGYTPEQIEQMDVREAWKIARSSKPLLQQTEEQSDRWYYSQLVRVVDNIPQERMTAEQLMAAVKRGAVKEDELEWTGFREWVESKGTGAKVTKQEALDYLRENNVQVEEKTLKEITSTTPETESTVRYEHYVLPGGKNYRELLFYSPKSEGFDAPHFDQEGHNLLAHVRFDERVDTDGKRVLFVEEVQSDWHQAGRQQGYLPDITGWKAEIESPGPVGDKYHIISADGRSEWHDVYGYSEQDAILRAAGIDRPEKAPPSAPFSKSWLELVMKRMIRWASENGFDRISWTTGAQQFERWGSESITWKRAGDNWFVEALEQKGGHAGGIDIEVEATARGLNAQNSQVISSRDELESIVRNITQRKQGDYSSENYEKYVKKLTDRVWGKMQAQDIGNFLPRKEGMEGFYDRDLSDALNRYVKKWGTSVGSIDIDVENYGEVPAGWAVVEYENEWWGGTGTHVKTFDTEKEARDFVSNSRYPETYDVHPNTELGNIPDRVHSIDITPDMRKSVMRGQPLFQKVEEDLHSYPVKTAVVIDGVDWVRLVGGTDASKELDNVLGQVAKDLGIDLRRVGEGQYVIPGMDADEVAGAVKKLRGGLVQAPVRFTDKDGGIWEVAVSFNDASSRVYADARAKVDTAFEQTQARQAETAYRRLGVQVQDDPDPRMVMPVGAKRVYTNLDEYPERYHALFQSVYDPNPQPRTDTPQFRAWFRESKAVGALGIFDPDASKDAPLKMYHGTSGGGV